MKIDQTVKGTKYRFNEAGAVRPRKMINPSEAIFLPYSFNEAGAVRPRKID